MFEDSATDIAGQPIRILRTMSRMCWSAHPVRSNGWAGAGFVDLADQINWFFGSRTGRFLADQIIYPGSAQPGWSTRQRTSGSYTYSEIGILRYLAT